MLSFLLATLLSSASLLLAYDFENQSSGHAILYNISSLGHAPQKVDEPTKVHYEQKIDIKESTDNRRGSVLTLMNGNIHSMGKVGGVSALGWSGTSGDQDTDAESTSTSSSTSLTDAHGLSGVWLAFTSSQAIAGGYSVNSRGVTTSNNVNVRNVTMRSNFTLTHPKEETSKEVLEWPPSSQNVTASSQQKSWSDRSANATAYEDRKSAKRTHWTFTFSLPSPNCQASTNSDGEWTMTCTGRI